MKRFLTAAAAAVLALLAPSAVARDYDFDLSNAASTAGISNNTLALQTGDTVRFVVDENPTTGYTWIYESHIERGLAEPVFTVEIDTYRAHNLPADGIVGAQGLAGAAGTRVIQINATNPGQDIFEVIHARDWEVNSTLPLASNNKIGYHFVNINVAEAQ